MLQKSAKVRMYKFRYYDNASSYRWMKWAVKYGIQTFCKSSLRIDRKYGYIIGQSNILSKSMDIEVEYNESLANIGNTFLYTTQYNKTGSITVSIWPYVNISRNYGPPTHI